MAGLDTFSEYFIDLRKLLKYKYILNIITHEDY